MTRPSKARRALVTASLLVASCLALAAPVLAKDGAIRRLTHDPDARTVELFAAQSEGLISVRVTPHDELRSNVFLTNNASEPLTVELPKAVAAVPVLKQFASINPFFGNSGNGANGNGPNAQNGQNNRNNAAQSVGGQLSPSGQQSLPFGSNSGNGQGFFKVNGQKAGKGNGKNSGKNIGGFFCSIPAEKTVQIELQSVCLDHGKRTPSSKMSYELVPLAEHAEDPALVALLESPEFFHTSRPALQAAAWNLQNGVPLKSLSRTTISDRHETFGASGALVQAQRLLDAARKSIADKPAASTVAATTPPRSSAAISRTRAVR